ncbi:hypothetical protein [Desulforapulum autotrophicum]|uniref:hypothetical protein n=1 Tax=Desulforapulum autotrophicum TaxID=2296 RepID=UPI0011D17CE3|nr:hypothetical protein [Desulforapulum autotrophicum]
MNTIEFCLHSLALGSLDSELQRDDLKNKVFSLIHFQFQALKNENPRTKIPGPAEIDKYSSEFINTLLNVKKGKEFTDRIYSISDNRFYEIRFRLLYELDAFDGSFTIQPSVECINLYLQALSQPLIDKTIATQAILEHQLRSGKLSQAIQTAEEHYKITLQQKQYLMELKTSISINLKSVHWTRDIIPRVEGAEENLALFLDSDKRILSHIENDPNLEGESVEQLAFIRKKVMDCANTYSQLLTEITTMGSHLRKAQDDQAFIDSSRYEHLPNIINDIFLPLMGLPKQLIPTLNEKLFPAIIPPSLPYVDDLTFIVNRALVERNMDENAVPEQDEFQEFLREEEPLVSEQDLSEILSLLDGICLTRESVLLSNLLDHLVDEGYSQKVAAVLLAHFIFQAPRNYHGFTAEKTDTTFKFENFSCDDVLLSRSIIEKAEEAL